MSCSQCEKEQSLQGKFQQERYEQEISRILGKLWNHNYDLKGNLVNLVIGLRELQDERDRAKTNAELMRADLESIGNYLWAKGYRRPELVTPAQVEEAILAAERKNEAFVTKGTQLMTFLASEEGLGGYSEPPVDHAITLIRKGRTDAKKVETLITAGEPLFKAIVDRQGQVGSWSNDPEKINAWLEATGRKEVEILLDRYGWTRVQKVYTPLPPDFRSPVNGVQGPAVFVRTAEVKDGRTVYRCQY